MTEIIATCWYVASRVMLIWGMYCVCSACGAYLESKGIPLYKKLPDKKEEKTQ